MYAFETMQEDCCTMLSTRWESPVLGRSQSSKVMAGRGQGDGKSIAPKKTLSEIRYFNYLGFIEHNCEFDSE